MENKKLTKKDYFEMIKGVCAENQEIVDFCNHEIELLSRKNSRSVSAKAQETNKAICEVLITELARINKPVTISDLLASSEVIRNYTYEDGKETKHLTNQKISAMLNGLVASKEVVKVVDKKKSFFSIAD